MERRSFMAMLTGGLLVAPLAAEAQQAILVPYVTETGPRMGPPPLESAHVADPHVVPGVHRDRQTPRVIPPMERPR